MSCEDAMNSVLTFLGDVFLPQPVLSSIDIPGEYVINLEAPITRRGTPAQDKVNLRCEENHIRQSFLRPPVAVCLANNHILDYGEIGYADTLSELKQLGIRWYGAGTLLENVNNPLMLEVWGTRVALLGYVCSSTHPVWATRESPGVKPIEIDQIRADVVKARNDGAMRVIVTFHWGTQDVARPRPDDVQIAHETINAGADLIVSHHSHCIQSYEIYKSKSIFYGLGNCVFPAFEVPSYFGANGQSVQRSRGRWFSWNDDSLVVQYDVQNGTLNTSGLRYSEGHLLTRRLSPSRFIMSAKEDLSSKYRTARRYSLLRQSMFSFLSEPRLGKLKNAIRVVKGIWQHNSD
jgi:hypothetical protein